MVTDGHPRPDELYRQGLLHFREGEWQAAIDAFDELQAAGALDADGEQLLADARFKLQLESVEEPAALPPPRRPILLRVVAIVGVLLVLAAAYQMYPLAVSAFRERDEALVGTTATAASTATAATTAEPDGGVAQEPITTTAEVASAPVIGDTANISGTVVITAGDTFFNTPANMEIIVDASGSMLGEVPGAGRQRWEVAQDALRSLISSGAIGEQTNVAVRTYGRRRSNDCTDVELVQGLNRFNPETLNRVVDTIKPVPNARTPLGASLRAASEDLQAAEGSTVVILVTDGLESEACGGDPVAEAAALVGGSDQRKLHVIGFAVDDPVANETLRALAETGKGLYFDADNSAQLADALRQAVELRYQIVNADGAEVAAGNVGQAPIQLPAGSYRLIINATPPIEKEFVVRDGDRLEILVRQGFGGLIADVLRAVP